MIVADRRVGWLFSPAPQGWNGAAGSPRDKWGQERRSVARSDDEHSGHQARQEQA
jgi:hypothetical protein